MLFDNLSKMSTDERSKQRVIDKAKTEMVYYTVIERMLAKYGVPYAEYVDPTTGREKTNYKSGSTDIMTMNFEALGSVRDQMAMAASDANAITYDSNGDVVSYNLDEVISTSISRSESLIKLLEAYAVKESEKGLSDDEKHEEALKLIQRELEPDGLSVFNIVKETINTFDQPMSEREYGMYDRHGNIVNVPISPLMPELENVHRVTDLDSGYGVSGANRIRIYSGYKTGSNRSIEYSYGQRGNRQAVAKGVYKYDGHTGVLTDGFKYKIKGSSPKDVVDRVIDTNAYIDNAKSSIDIINDGDKFAQGFKDKLALGITNTILKYSQQMLTDRDYDMIRKLASDTFENMYANMINNMESNVYEAVIAGPTKRNVRAVGLDPNSLDDCKDYYKAVCDQADELVSEYVKYIDDTCKYMKQSINHHEFQIHLMDLTHRYNNGDNNSKNSIIALYGSGDSRGTEYDVAKNQESRFMAVVAHAHYNSANMNLAIQPNFGDIVGAGYEPYVIGDIAQHGSTVESHVTSDTITKARALVDNYSHNRTDDLTIIRRETAVERFINNSGEIEAKELIQTIKNDRDTVSNNMRIDFLNDYNDIKNAVRSTFGSMTEDALTDEQAKETVASVIHQLSLAKFETQVNDQLVYKYFHDSLITDINNRIDALGANVTPTSVANIMSNMLKGSPSAVDKIVRNSCDDLFGSDDLIKVDRYAQYSTIPYINQIIQLASNLKQCQYIDASPTLGNDYREAKVNDAAKGVDGLYFTTFINPTVQTIDMSANDEETSDETRLAEDNEADADEKVEAIDNAKYKAMFINTSENDITWNWINSDDKDAVVYRATHPLQYEVFSRVRRSIGSVDIKMTSSGIIYHATDSEIRFKVGPIIDEEAFVMPVLKDGTPSSEIVIDDYGELQNVVKFGALDLKSVGGATVNNRIYGLSGKIGSYDGYNHDEKYTDRVDLSTYQMGVLNEVDKCLALHSIAFKNQAANLNRDSYNVKKNVYMYYLHNFIGNVYNTGTYIIENKEKAEIASRYLTKLVDGTDSNPFEDIVDYDYINSDALFNTARYETALHQAKHDNPDIDEDLFKAQYRAEYTAMVEDAVVRNVQTYMMQLEMDHGRCVMPKIKLDQNIGLYNVILNIGENNASKMIGLPDRKNLRDSDCMSRRIVGFQDNDIFDGKLTGSAKRVGAIMYLAEGATVNPITGELTTSGNQYSTIINTGIKDFEGNKVADIVKYNGGQALDRIQLSVYAQLKGLTYVPNAEFAMMNLTDNMEDGYTITKEMAKLLGHFEFNESTGKFEYEEAVIGDKIGDSESGNKGIIARIIDTDMTSEEFIAKETERFLISHVISDDLDIDDANFAKIVDLLNEGRDDAINSSNMYDLLSNVGDMSEDDQQSFYNKLHDAVINGDVNAPKYDSFISNVYAQYSVFKENPNIKVIMTNVCVLTRSNPSLIMHVSDTNKSLMLNGVEYPGAVGSCTFYLDSHTANDKNRTYGEYGSAKGGRSHGAQEMFAYDARKCNDALVRLMISQDKYIGSKIDKMNKRFMMNGLLIDAEDNFKVSYAADHKFEIHDGENGQVIVDSESGHVLSQPQNFQVQDMHELAVKMLESIDTHLGQDDKNKLSYTNHLIAEELKNAVFNSVVSKTDTRESADKEQNSQLANNYINAWFNYLTCVPDTFISIPESIDDDVFKVYYGNAYATVESEAPIDMAGGLAEDDIRPVDPYADDDVFGEFDGIDDDIFGPYDPDEIRAERPEQYKAAIDRLSNQYLRSNSLIFNIDDKKYMPLFTGVETNVSADEDSDTSVSKVKIKTQMDIFKNILAYNILEELEHRGLEGRIDNYDSIRDSINESKNHIKNRLVNICNGITTDKSLTLTDVKDKFKSDIYRFTAAKSYTAVWSGDGSNLNLNQVGISFKMAKEMGLVHRNTKEELKYPDTFENMIKNGYSKIDPKELVFVNRSPGQTTGCMRALHPVIINDDSMTIKIHPSIATVFDGDFDGDTVGVIHIPNSKEYSDIYDAAMEEAVRTISLETNLVKSAEYKVVEGESGNKIKYVHPLFIAGNADVGIGLYYAQNEREKAGNPIKISKELDEITIKANILEQYKQLANDLDAKLVYGDITGGKNQGNNSSLIYTPNIIKERLAQISEFASYSKDMSEFNEQLKTGACKGLMDVVTDYLDTVDNVSDNMGKFDTYIELVSKVHKAILDPDKRDSNGNVKIDENIASEIKDTISRVGDLSVFDANGTLDVIKAYANGKNDVKACNKYSDFIASSTVEGALNLNVVVNKNAVTSAGAYMEQYINTHIVGNAGIKEARTNICKEEVANYDHINSIYTEAMKNANCKCFTAGASDYEKIEKIVAEANISRKGKAPQLNALLKYSGMHKSCFADGKSGLMIDKDKESGKFMIFNADGTKVSDKQRENYIKNLKMDVSKAKADVPVNDFRNENQSNMTAQSDKADATGLGGAVAQKMQKYLSALGYSEVALKVSGPITQRYLDAKQNVAACETNLTVGKYVLNDIMTFKEVLELKDENFQKQDYVKTRNGQFTSTGNAVTINEGVAQINNLIKMMDLTSDGLEALSPIDVAVIKACSASVLDANGDYDKIAKDFVKECNDKNNQAYSIMYTSNSPAVIDEMAKSERSIFDKTMIGEHAMAEVQKAMWDATMSRDVQDLILLKETFETISDGMSKGNVEKKTEVEAPKVVTSVVSSVVTTSNVHQRMERNTERNMQRSNGGRTVAPGGRGRGGNLLSQRSEKVQERMDNFKSQYGSQDGQGVQSNIGVTTPNVPGDN